MVPVRQDPRHRDRAERRHRSACRGLITPSLDEMVVRRASEMERRGIDAAAPDRRRDDQPAAHGGEDRAGVRAADGARARRLARRRRRRRACSTRDAARAFDAREPRRCRSSCASSTRQRERKPLLPYRRRRARTACDRLVAPTTSPAPAFLGARGRSTSPLAELRAVHRLDVLLHGLGAEGQVSRRSSSTRSTAPRRASCSTNAQALLDRDRRREAAARRAASTASGRRDADGDDIVVYTDEARRRAGALPDAAPAGGERDGRPNLSLADFVAPRGSGVTDYLGAFAVTAGHRRRRAGARASRRSTTTTTRSWSRRSPTGWPRRSPSTCTSARAATGATDRPRRSRSEDLIEREVPRHPPGVRLPGVPRPHARSASCSTLLDAERAGHRADRDLRDDAGRERQRPLLRAPARRATSPSAASAATRSRTTRARKGMPLDEVERWLRPNLGYEPAPDTAGVGA